MKELERTKNAEKGGLPRVGEKAYKEELLEIIETCDDVYFLKSTLTYVRCLKKALDKK